MVFRPLRQSSANGHRAIQSRKTRQWLSAKQRQPQHLHAITGRGRLIGLWEYGPSVAKIVYLTFDKPPKELPAAIKDTETYITDQLGDARFFQP